MSHTRNTESELIKKYHDQWCVDNGYKLQAPSLKPQAIQASSGRRQAPSSKLQATSRKRQAP